MKLKNLTGLADKKRGALKDVLIKDGYATVANAYMAARVPILAENTPNGVYQKGYFEKPILSIENKTIFYGDETKSPEIEPANLGTDFYPDVDKLLDADHPSNSAIIDLAKLKKLLAVFTEQGLPFVKLEVPTQVGKPVRIVGVLGGDSDRPNKQVTGVLMPLNKDKEEDNN